MEKWGLSCLLPKRPPKWLKHPSQQSGEVGTSHPAIVESFCLTPAHLQTQSLPALPIISLLDYRNIAPFIFPFSHLVVWYYLAPIIFPFGIIICHNHFAVSSVLSYSLRIVSDCIFVSLQHPLCWSFGCANVRMITQNGQRVMT